MLPRYFSIDEINEEQSILYDPCSGNIYVLPNEKETGRILKSDNFLHSLTPISQNGIKRKYPISICWSPITACNLNCRYCLDDKYLSVINSDKLISIAKNISMSNILGVDISGGEPLLIKQLPQILKTLSNNKLVISITTNGSFLEHRFNEIKDHIDAIRVSFDGHNSDAHDKLRGVGSFSSAIKSVRLAVKSTMPIQIQFVAMKSNIKYLKDMFQLSSDEGVNGLTILQMLPLGEGKDLFHSESITDEELSILIEEIDVPSELILRVRKRKDAENFIVVRADGNIYQNSKNVTTIDKVVKFKVPTDIIIENE